MCNRSRCWRRRPGRRAFTLVELLVSIIIIGILMALLLPAIGAVRRNVQIAQVRNDIAQLETALSEFKTQFGMYPPSGITLYESSADWKSDTTGSSAIIRTIWPQFDFNLNRDINGNGPTTDTFELTGSECLVFFLGGIIVGGEDDDQDGVLDAGEDDNGNGILDLGVPTGFSANPADPFATGGTNRVGPFYNFLANRLIPPIPTSPPAPLNWYTYCDTLPGQTQPYLYASSRDGAGYNDNDLDPSTMESVYMQTIGANGRAWNPKTIQLISPGFDGEYGVGGLFNPATADTDLINYDANPTTPPNYTDDPNDIFRDFERDNITNFHSGALAP